jgi:hypothetical protein
MASEQLLAIARQAATPGRGWAAMCDAVAGGVAPEVLAPLRALHLADDALALQAVLHGLRPIPRRVDTLIFTARGRGVLAIAGGRGDVAVWAGPELALEATAAVRRAAGRERGRRRDVLLALELGAAALIARFAAGDLRQRVAVALPGGGLAEIAPRRPRRRRAPPPA